jgi:hypothetical protein
VTDLDREVGFLREVGASLVLRELVSLVGEEREYAILMLGAEYAASFQPESSFGRLRGMSGHAQHHRNHPFQPYGVAVAI